MTIPLGPAVGIDLGTTFSAVARLDDAGRPVTVPNAEGDLTTPSVVLFDGDDVVVGKEAVKAMATEAERVADCAKRDMGSREYRRTVDNKRFPPEVLQAYVLKKLRDDAARQIPYGMSPSAPQHETGSQDSRKAIYGSSRSVQNASSPSGTT